MSLYLDDRGAKLVKKDAQNSLTSDKKAMALKQVVCLGLIKISEMKQEASDEDAVRLPSIDVPLLMPEKELSTVELISEPENDSKPDSPNNLFQ